MEYLFTERAHLMCPNMCFGMMAEVSAEFDKEKIKAAFSKMSEAHPFLRALLGYEKEGNRYFYDIKDESRITLFIKDEELGENEDETVLGEYKKLTGRDFDLFEEGMLKASVWKKGNNTCFLLIFHHLLTDGRGALGLTKELAEHYKNGTPFKESAERLITSKTDFIKENKLSFISDMLVKRANKTWVKEGNKPVSYQEYHEYADRFVKENPVAFSIKRIGMEELQQTVNDCHENGITVNDILLSRMMIEEKTGKIIIANDLRDKCKEYTDGALGNYSTAFSVVIKNLKEDEISLAKDIHKKVKEITERPKDLYLVLLCYAVLDPALLDAAFMAAKGAHESKAAEFIGTKFFAFDSPSGYSITNLGKIESDSIKNAYFIPPASPAMKKTKGVLTVNKEMTICVSEH